jgi:uncharacterized repeat protein (TIGR04052 family)
MNTPMKLGTLVITAVLAACGGGGGDSTTAVAPPAPVTPVTPATPVAKAVTIQFAAVAGSANTPVNCTTPIAALGSTPTEARLADLRIYLTNVQLVNDAGVAVPVTLTSNEWQQTSGADSVALIDLENGQAGCSAEGTAATNAVITGTVPEGNYVRVKATIGVPEKLSHSDVMASAAPLDIMAMGWSWQAGRKFAKIEINPVGGVTTTSATGSSTVATYNLHQASTDCTGRNDGTDTCAKKNLAEFNLSFNATTQQVAIDLVELFGTTNVRVNQNDAIGCMSATSDLDCPTLFTKMGLNLSTGGQASSPQVVFRTIAK